MKKDNIDLFIAALAAAVAAKQMEEKEEEPEEKEETPDPTFGDIVKLLREDVDNEKYLCMARKEWLTSGQMMGVCLRYEEDPEDFSFYWFDLVEKEPTKFPYNVTNEDMLAEDWMLICKDEE